MRSRRADRLFGTQLASTGRDELLVFLITIESTLSALLENGHAVRVVYFGRRAQSQSRRLEVIANNIANVDTVGFKRDLAIMQSRYAEADQRGIASPGDGSINDVGGGVQFHQTVTDFSNGPLHKTGTPTDVALQGDGFFVVQKGQQRLLTRAGNFRLTAAGNLVTQQGYPVLGEGNSPISVNPLAGPWRISASGTVIQDSTRQDLQIAKPVSLGDLVKTGENLFRSLSNVRPVAPAERSVSSGYLEMSTVQPTTEMTTLIETSRLIEANINVMKTHNEMIQGLVERVLTA